MFTPALHLQYVSTFYLYQQVPVYQVALINQLKHVFINLHFNYNLSIKRSLLTIIVT